MLIGLDEEHKDLNVEQAKNFSLKGANLNMIFSSKQEGKISDVKEVQGLVNEKKKNEPNK